MPFWVYRQLQLLKLIDHQIHTLAVNRIQNYCIHQLLYPDFTLSLTYDIGKSLTHHILPFARQEEFLRSV